MNFEYEAIDQSKQRRKGEVEADNKQAASMHLRNQGLTIISLRVIKEEKQAEDILERFRKVKAEDLVLATRQLAIMIDSGVTVAESLRILVNQTESSRLAKALTEVADDVESGRSLSESLQKHSTIFNRLYVGLVRAGESSGDLDKTLLNLADTLERNMRLSRTLKSAMVYPVVVAGVSIVLSLGIIVFIVPQFEKMFNQFGGKLPAPTQALVEASHVLVPTDNGIIAVQPLLAFLFFIAGLAVGLTLHGIRRMPALVCFIGMFATMIGGWAALYFLGDALPGAIGHGPTALAVLVRVAFILLGIVGMIFGMRAWSRTEAGRYSFDVIKLHIPMKIGKLIRKITVARWTGTLSTLVNSGMPLSEALEVVGEASSNYIYDMATQEIREGVVRGEKLSQLIDDTDAFPPMVVSMVAVGERTGEIDTMLQKIAEYYDYEIDATLKALASIVEPVMMVIIGAIVGTVVVCLFLPMFSLYQTIAQQSGALIVVPALFEAWRRRMRRA